MSHAKSAWTVSSHSQCVWFPALMRPQGPHAWCVAEVELDLTLLEPEAEGDTKDDKDKTDDEKV